VHYRECEREKRTRLIRITTKKWNIEDVLKKEQAD